MAEAQFIAKRNWSGILTPCILGAGFCVFAIIQSFLKMDQTMGWSFIGVIIFLPASFVLILLDLIVKGVLKGKTVYIWVVELIIIGIALWAWWYHLIN